MVRFLISVVIFLTLTGVALFVFLLATWIIAHGTGTSVVVGVGSPAGILILALLGFLSFWLSGKLTKA